MNPLNYEFIYWLTQGARKIVKPQKYQLRKKNTKSENPRLSIILLDWSCRERFHALDWLKDQDVPRDQYELIWVELYHRVVPEVLEKVDSYITCDQKGMYHKHMGYNAGALQARGELVCICDSDAVFPPDFVSSIFKGFYGNGSMAIPLVLMHHEKRTAFSYPEKLENVEELNDPKWNWWRLKPNAGACATFRKTDIIRYGGFDEHRSYRGYFCGAYDLVWRLINAGIPEVWHDASTVLWHFAHADPVGVNKIKQSFDQILEMTYPHVDCHALTAVEAFSSGRLLPCLENREIFTLRMKGRSIGSLLEKKYAFLAGPQGFSGWPVFWLRLGMFFELSNTLFIAIISTVPLIRKMLNFLNSFKSPINDTKPKLVKVVKGYNIIYLHGFFYALPQSLGKVDVDDFKQMQNPIIKSSQSLKEIEKLMAAE